MNLFRSLLLLCCVGVFSACSTVPLDRPKEASYALVDVADTDEAEDASEWLDNRSNVNGFYPASEGFDAFGARLVMIDNAEKSIDAQYFLMKPDNAGLVFTGKLMEAADRGVRVRLLIDDIFTSVDDVDFAVINAHPNVQIRIFNPISRKGIYSFNYLGNFGLLNRRMHNKAFVVDNSSGIVGGRNIADEYFQLLSSGEFFDFDMLAAGPVVKEVSAEFDRYWNHRLAVPMEWILEDDGSKKFAEARAGYLQEMADAGQTIYGEAISSQLMQRYYSGELEPFFAPARVLADDPDKLLVKVSEESKQLANDIRDAVAVAENEVVLLTPYFIPGKAGMEIIEALRERDVRVIVLTNSLATNNHTSVHSAYSSYRKRLLKAGVELWEARANAIQAVDEEGNVSTEQLTLHTKGVLIDRRRLFVGSLNLDPRSIDINTEMGLLIDSAELGAYAADSLSRDIPEIAYRLMLDENEKITWHANIGGEPVVETGEPLTTRWRRFSAWFLKILPEGQL